MHKCLTSQKQKSYLKLEKHTRWKSCKFRRANRSRHPVPGLQKYTAFLSTMAGHTNLSVLLNNTGALGSQLHWSISGPNRTSRRLWTFDPFRRTCFQKGPTK
jgi:hypothetical protein